METEKKVLEEPNAEEKAEPKKEKKLHSSHSKKFLILGGLAALLLIASGIIFFVSSNNTLKKEAKKTTTNTSRAVSDRLRARKALIDPKTASLLQVYTDNKMVIRLSIPAGSLKEKTEITLIPYKDAANHPQVMISPSNTVFRKPVTLTYDLSRTSVRTDAPKSVSLTRRSTGQTQVLKIEGTTKVQQLIARSTETSTSVSSRLLSGGTYTFVLTGNQLENARHTLNQKKASALSVLESGTVLSFASQKLTKDEKDRINKTVAKVISIADASSYELFPALILQKKLATQTFRVIPQVYAADLAAGFFEFRCKDKTLSVEEYVVAAQTAQLMGHDDIGEKCLDAAKNRVADEANKVLSQAQPAVSEVVRMLGKVQMFGLADLDIALQEKLRKTIEKNTEDILKDPNASLTDVIKALQDAQLTGTDGKYSDSLNQKITEIASREIDQVLSDPNANMIDVAKAVQKAQALGIEAKANQGIEQLKQMSNRSSEQIMDNPNSTAKELQDALGQASLEGKDQAYKNEIRDRIKDAEKKESEPEPTPTPSPTEGDSEENLELNIDFGSAMGLAMLQLVGLESFDEESIKNFVQEKTDQANELLELGPEVCDMVREMGGELYTADVAKNCEYLEGGEAQRDIDEAHDKAFEEAEKIGDIQSDEYEAPDYEPHMEFEITPTPEEDYQVEDDITNTDDAGINDGLEEETQEDESDTSESEMEVQGAQTKNYVNIFLDSVNKILHPSKK